MRPRTKPSWGSGYEIVEPLTSACGIPYRSEMGWKWDWHIIPGDSVAYTRAQRERMIDEAMRKFREVFGCYPKSIGGWVIDTHTLNYLAEHYDITAAAICRDQANTDAYTLIGGYFNQAYYPSKNNIFTPAQSQAMQTPVPVFRLLGLCPIHNFDKNKYSSDALRAIDSNCFTMEPCWHMGSTPDAVKWMFDSYYGQESLGFAYAQTGQENSFHGATPRVFRHTFTTVCRRSGMDEKTMQVIGGWSDIATMRNVYTHVQQTDLQRAGQLMGGMFQTRNLPA